MNAKNEPTYVVEEVKEPWIKSKAAKLTGIIAGGVLALGAAFGAGLVLGSEGHRPGPLGIAGIDRDGDHKFPGGIQPDAQHQPRPGDQDGDHR
ncbi:MAG: hypothetical protein RLZZ471_1135 [Actinomycetota bacterium]